MLETLALMGHGFVNAMSLSNLLFMAGGTAIGIIIGCLPGLSAAMGVALLLPMTFTMAPETGLIVLGAIYCGAIFGGSISAILIHTPGTPASAATAIEGYQLTLHCLLYTSQDLCITEKTDHRHRQQSHQRQKARGAPDQYGPEYSPGQEL